MALQLRRGTDAQRGSVIFDQGELIYTTDTKKVYVGDGSTAGGITVGDFDISSVIEDTSPQLGGALDLNGFNITGTGNISITGNITVPSANTVAAGKLLGTGTSGNITIESVDGSTLSGNIQIFGVDTAIAGQEGGDILIYAGNGLTTGGGGDIDIYGGNGGASNGNGGYVILSGGSSTAGTGLGGNIIIQGGSGSVQDGSITIGNSNTYEITIGSTGVTTNLNGTINATRIDGDLQGGVFADDSTILLDSTFPGGRLQSAEAVIDNLFLCETYSNTPTSKSLRVIENTNTNFFETIANADSLGASVGPHLALQVYRSSPQAGDAGGRLRFFQSAANPSNPIQALVSIDTYAETIGIAAARGEMRFSIWNQITFDTVQTLKSTAVIFNKPVTLNGGGLQVNGAGTFTSGVTADLKGSVVADDSTMLVDGVGGKIVGPVDSPSVMTPLLDTNDSSAITIVPEVIMSSDATVQNNLTVTNSLTAQQASSTIYTLTPTVEPMNPTAGMIAASNGTTWNPALDGQEHLNVYLNGAWTQLA